MGFRAVCPIPGGRYGDVEQAGHALIARVVVDQVWRVDLPAMPRYVTCAWFHGRLVALATQSRAVLQLPQPGDHAILFTPMPVVLGTASGWPDLWRSPDGQRLFATVVRNRSTWETLDVSACVDDPTAAPVSVEVGHPPDGSDAIHVHGIAYMRDGKPVWRNAVDAQGRVLAGYARRRVMHGVDLLIPIELEDGTVVGQASGSDWPTVAHRDGLSTLATEKAEVKGCRLDDGYIFAIDYLARAGASLVRVIPPAWPPYQAPRPQVPDPTAPTPLIWRVIDGWSNRDGHGHTQPGNAAWGQPTDARPVLEGVPWASDVVGPLLAVLVGTERDHQPYETKTAQLVAAIKEAKRRGCPVAVYCDDDAHRAQADEMADIVRANDVRVVRVVQAYLRAGERPSAAVTRVSHELERLHGQTLALMQRADGEGSELDELQFAVRVEDELVPRIALQAVFGGRRPGAHQAVLDWHGRVIAAMRAGVPAPLGRTSTPTIPTIPRKKEDDMTRKTVVVALRRDFPTPRYLSVSDDRRSVDARLTDWRDPRAHFEVNIFDQPGSTPGQHGVGNKVLLRSVQDQVCVFPHLGATLGAALDLGGLFEIRAGEFPGTWDYLIPAAERAITVHDDGRVTIERYKSVAWSQHGFRVIDVATGKEIHGPF